MTAGIPCIEKVGVGDLLSRMSGKNSARYRANAPRTFVTLPKRLQRWYREALDNISETLFTFSGKAREGYFENWPMIDCSEWVNQYNLEVFQPPVHRELAELNWWGWACLPHFPSWKHLYLLKFEKSAKPAQVPLLTSGEQANDFLKPVVCLSTGNAHVRASFKGKHSVEGSGNVHLVREEPLRSGGVLSVCGCFIFRWGSTSDNFQPRLPSEGHIVQATHSEAV